MNDINDMQNEDKHSVLSWQNEHSRGKIAAGFFVVVFGMLFLLKELNFPIASWIFTWPMFLIAAGTVTLIKHKFRKISGYVLILIGKLFLLKHFAPDLINFKIIWPLLIILFGVTMIFKPRKFRQKHLNKKRFHHKKKAFQNANNMNFDEVNKEDFIDATSFFGGIEKNVVSKNFIGADIVTFFGGSEINLMNSDIQGKAIIDTINMFGGLKLIIPSNWKVSSELTTIFGSIEDKRIVAGAQKDDDKVLILKGTCIFGGIEICEY